VASLVLPYVMQLRRKKKAAEAADAAASGE
jgi:hypothetical protein